MADEVYVSTCWRRRRGMKFFLVQLLPVLAVEAAIYCDETTSVKWDRIGIHASDTILQCSQDAMICWYHTLRADCSAISYDGDKKQCALLKEQKSAGNVVTMCDTPQKIQTPNPSGFAPNCTNITGIEKSTELFGMCYYTLAQTMLIEYDQILTVNNLYACHSGRRNSRLAYIPNITVSKALQRAGMYRSGYYYSGGRQMPPDPCTTRPCKGCTWSANSPHCQNWHWTDWDGSIIGNISTTGFWSSGEPANGKVQSNGQVTQEPIACIYAGTPYFFDCAPTVHPFRPICEFDL